MTTGADAGKLPAAYLSAGSSSFTEFVGAHAPQLLPSRMLIARASEPAYALCWCVSTIAAKMKMPITIDGSPLRTSSARRTARDILDPANSDT